MPALTSDIHAWGGRATHSHIPPEPLWVGLLRIWQAVMALITLALSGFALSVFNGYSGFGLNIFTSLLTWIFLAYIFVTAFAVPQAYSVWAQLGLEIALFIFWLSTWAVIASLAAAFGDWYSYGYDKWSAAVACTKAAAALGAFVWVSFIATLVNLSITLHRHITAGNPTIAGGVTTEVKMEPVATAAPVEPYPQQPYPQQPYVQQPYVQQQTV